MKRLQRKKRLFNITIIMFLAILTLCFAWSGNVKAQMTGSIKGSNVNMRDSAGTNGGKLAVLNAGDTGIISDSKKDAQGNVWYQITVKKNGKDVKGYVISTYVNCKEDASQNSENTSQSNEQPGAQANAPQTNVEQSNSQATKSKSFKATINAENVNIRKEALNGAVLCKLGKDNTVTVKKSKTAADGKVWYYISFKVNQKTKKGWIRSDFVKEKSSSNVTVLDAQTDVTEVITNSQQTSVNTSQNSSGKQGEIKGTNVNMRKQPVNGAVVCKLNAGQKVTITSQKKGTDQKNWLRITFTYNGQKKKGYVREDFITRIAVVDSTLTNTNQNQVQNAEENNQEPVMGDAEFEAYLKAQNFPQGYYEPLKALHKAHPGWVFKAVDTKLDFEEVIKAESKVGLNFVAKSSIASWKSTEKAAYDWNKNNWYTFDGGNWVAASSDIIRYYIDPRNFFDETSIFQFETLEYEDYQSIDGLKKLLASSFMKGDYTEPDGTVKSYAETFLEVGKQNGVNPYHLAARCFQEQGKGNSDSISGKVAGLENYFNYYNIGAYASGGNSPTKQGLIYASSTTNTAANYERPWNTRYKSILGGAEYVAQKYIKVGQNTLYFQKFNVVNTKNGIYKHQYMTNLQAAASEAVKLSKAYASQSEKLVFLIPVYSNMPQEKCVKPDSKANPNNYLSQLQVANQELTPSFKPDIDSYSLIVKKKVEKVEITASSVATTSQISGCGEYELERGENTISISCKAENGNEKIYTIKITRK